jgi:hypothetical protein
MFAAIFSKAEKTKMAKSLLDKNHSYTFSNYFDLGIIATDLLAEFGYTLSKQQLQLPLYPGELERLEGLKRRIDEILPYVDSENEATRREFTIAPIIAEVIHYSHARVRVEYNLKLSDRLQGTLDYYLQSHNSRFRSCNAYSIGGVVTVIVTVYRMNRATRKNRYREKVFHPFSRRRTHVKE